MLAQGVDEAEGEDRIGVMRHLARLARRSNELERSRETLVHLLAERPNDRRARAVLNALLEREGRWDELDASLEKETKEALRRGAHEAACRSALRRARMWDARLDDQARAALRYMQAAQYAEKAEDFERAFYLRLLWLHSLHRSGASHRFLEDAVAVTWRAGERVGQGARATALAIELGLPPPKARRPSGPLPIAKATPPAPAPPPARRGSAQLELLAVADAAEKAGEKSVAAAVLNAAVREGEDPLAVARLEAHYVQRGAWRPLAEFYRQQVSRASTPDGRASWSEKLAELLESELDDPTGAAAAWADVASATGDSRAEVEQARLLGRRRDATGVRAALDAGVDRAANQDERANALVLRAEEASTRKDLAAARVDLEKALFLSPGHPAAAAGLAELAAAAGETTPILELEAALALVGRHVPGRGDLYRRLARLAQAQWGPERAKGAWAEVLAELPDDEEALSQERALTGSSADGATRIAVLRTSIAKEPRSARTRAARLELAEALERAGRPLDALEALEDATRADPQDQRAWLALADRLTALGNRDAEAARALEMAAETAEELPGATASGELLGLGSQAVALVAPSGDGPALAPPYPTVAKKAGDERPRNQPSSTPPSVRVEETSAEATPSSEETPRGLVPLTFEEAVEDAAPPEPTRPVLALGSGPEDEPSGPHSRSKSGVRVLPLSRNSASEESPPGSSAPGVERQPWAPAQGMPSRPADPAATQPLVSPEAGVFAPHASVQARPPDSEVAPALSGRELLPEPSSGGDYELSVPDEGDYELSVPDEDESPRPVEVPLGAVLDPPRTDSPAGRLMTSASMPEPTSAQPPPPGLAPAPMGPPRAEAGPRQPQSPSVVAVPPLVLGPVASRPEPPPGTSTLSSRLGPAAPSSALPARSSSSGLVAPPLVAAQPSRPAPVSTPSPKPSVAGTVGPLSAPTRSPPVHAPSPRREPSTSTPSSSPSGVTAPLGGPGPHPPAASSRPSAVTRPVPPNLKERSSTGALEAPRPPRDALPTAPEGVTSTRASGGGDPLRTLPESELEEAQLDLTGPIRSPTAGAGGKGASDQRITLQLEPPSSSQPAAVEPERATTEVPAPSRPERAYASSGSSAGRRSAMERLALLERARSNPLEPMCYRLLAEYFDGTNDPTRADLMRELSFALEGEPQPPPRAPPLILTGPDRLALKHPSLRADAGELLTLLSRGLCALYPTPTRDAGTEVLFDFASGPGARAAAEALSVAIRILGLKAPPVHLSADDGPPFSLVYVGQPRLLVGTIAVKRVLDDAELRFFAGRALFTQAAELLPLRLIRREQLVRGMAVVGEVSRGQADTTEALVLRDAVAASSWERVKTLIAALAAKLDVGQLADGARHTANRAGLVVCGGVGPALAALKAKQALQSEIIELVRFAGSERYLQLRIRYAAAPSAS